MEITKTNNKKVVIILSVVIILVAATLLWIWLGQRGSVVPAISDNSEQARLMTDEEKIRYQIDTNLEVEIVNESEGNFIYQIKK